MMLKILELVLRSVFKKNRKVSRTSFVWNYFYLSIIFHPFILLLFLVFRVINLYYSLIIDYQQEAAYSFSRPSPLSPVHKAFPISKYSETSWEQRIAVISTFADIGMKRSRNTSFLQCSSLIHFADSLRGSYLHYMVSVLSSSIFCLIFFHIISFPWFIL